MLFNKTFLIILLSLLCLSCQESSDAPAQSALADERINIPQIERLATDVELRPNEGLIYYDDAPFSGYVLKWHPNNQLAERISYYRGKKHGLREQWYSNGQAKLSAEYRDGKFHGASLSWWQNGNLRSQGNFFAGKVHGTVTQWYKEGMIFKEMNYQHGKELGMQKAWRKNGKLYNNYEAKNGRIFGLKRANLCFELQDEKL